MLRRCLRVGVLLCLVFLIAGCSRTDAAPIVPTAVSTVGPTNLTYVVQRGWVTRELEFTGRISPVEEVPLYFKTGGYVKQVLVQPGDQVKAGDLLAELEAELGLGSLQNQISSAELNLAVARARLTRAEEANTYAIVQAEMSLLLGKEQVARTRAFQATYTAGTVRARVDLERAQDEVARAEVDHQEAVSRYWTPPEHAEAYALALQQARWNLETAQAQYDQAIANEGVYQRELKIAEIAVKQAEAELEQLSKGVDPVLALEVRQAQQVLDRLKESSQIIAPVDGEIISLSLYAGRLVEPFRPVIVIADPSVIEVSAGLSDDQLKDMTEGQRATVVLSTHPDRAWAGTVRRLPYPYGTGDSVESLAGVDNSTRISLEGDVGDLKLGGLVRVTIILEEKDDALWLPPTAIRTFQGRQFVVVQDGGRQRRVDVGLGVEGQDQVEILKGLEEGQLIVAP
jgi:multidrug efflux pump subunit AcrA (membrane-fusion protein)